MPLKSRTTKRFRKLFSELPIEIQESAIKCYELWRENPSHPSLHFKMIKNIYSVRISDRWRVLGMKEAEADVYVWIWIGSHEEYNKLIK